MMTMHQPPDAPVLDATPSRYVVAVGISTWDIAGSLSSSSAIQANGAGAGEIRDKPGGCARNAAENLARLGCACHLLSVFGADAAGMALLAATQAAGVEVGAALVLPQQPSARCLILNRQDGEHFYILYDELIAEQLTPAYLSAQQALLAQAAVILTNTGIPAATLAWLMQQHGQQPLFVDTVSLDEVLAIRPWLAQVHTLKTNRREASLLAGMPFDSREQAPSLAAWFLRQGVRQVVFSLGGYGLYYSDGQVSGWLPAWAASVVNVTGAGDAVLAGLAYGRLQGLTFVESVHFANACAALTVQSRDNCCPDLHPERVRTFLAQEPSPPAGAS